MKLNIGVFSSAAVNINRELEKKAYVVGQEIAKQGAILLSGGVSELIPQIVEISKKGKTPVFSSIL